MSVEEAQRSIIEATGSAFGAVSDIGERPEHWYWRRAARAWEERARVAEARLTTAELLPATCSTCDWQIPGLRTVVGADLGDVVILCEPYHGKERCGGKARRTADSD